MAVTPEELAAQGVTSDLKFAARALGIGDSTAYAAAHKGNFPCRVIKIGGRYIVPTAELRAVLGQESPPAPSESRSPGTVQAAGTGSPSRLHNQVLADLLGRISSSTDSTDVRNYAEAYAFVAQHSPT